MRFERFESVFSYRKISYVLGSNWSQKVSKLESKMVKNVSEILSDGMVSLGFRMTNGVRSFDGNV